MNRAITSEGSFRAGSLENDIHGPWSAGTRVTVLLMCQGAATEPVVASLNSLFASSVQNFDIVCILVERAVRRIVEPWTQADSRVRFDSALPDSLPSTGYVLVMRAGLSMTPFSIEALLNVVLLPGVEVVRTIVEGHPGTLELWDASGLVDEKNRLNAEAKARQNGHERWVSAEGAGIHGFGQPAPRVFFRRGSADRHVLDVVAFDAASKRYMDKKAHEIAILRREIRDLKSLFGSTNVKRSSIVRKVASKVLNHYRTPR